MNQIIPLHRGSFKSEREAALHLIDTSEQGSTSTAWIPANNCNGNCNQGRACDCVAAVESVESAHPWIWLLYIAGFVFGCALFAVFKA